MTFQALLFCPDEKTARVATQVLNELEFSVEPCTEPFAAVKKLMGQRFDAVVVDCDNEQNAGLLFKSARNSSSNQSALAVAVVEGQAGVANAFRIGANLVLTKPINVEQAKSTLRVARGLLRKSAEGAKPAPAATSAAPAPAPPARPAVQSSQPARPAVSTPPTPTPTFADFHPPKPEPSPVAKASVEAGSVFEVEAEPTPAPEPTEAGLLESMEENAPALPAPSQAKPEAGKPVASKEYPWQPVSKPSGAMATSLQHASEVAGKKPETASQGPAVAAKTGVAPFLKESRPLVTASVPGMGGAASAPAPAKDAWKPLAPLAPRDSTPAAPQPPAESPKPALTTPVPSADAPAPFAAPTFAALDSKPKAKAKPKPVRSGGSRTGVLLVVLLVVLAAAGYYGYKTGYLTFVKGYVDRVISRKPSVQPLSQAPAAQPVAPVAQPQASATPAQQQFQIETVSTGRASAKTSEAEIPEVVVTQKPTPRMVVKTDLGNQRAAQKPAPAAAVADVPAPTLSSASNGDQNAISNIVKSSPVSVPKISPSTEMLKISQGVTQGLLVKRVQPVYPHQAMQMRIQGAVQLQAVISKAGDVTGIKVLSGDPILARAAVDAVGHWKYKPYYLNGEPVDIQTQVTVNFKLP